MTNIDAILPCLTPNVRRTVEQFIERPTERNACYATGYLVAAAECGALLPEHRIALIQWIANTERGAGVLPLTEGERSLYRWREGGMGGFERALWGAIAAADSTNLVAIAKGFPTHVEAYISYTTKSGYWDALVKRIEGERS
jgi:hypothetical protein